MLLRLCASICSAALLAKPVAAQSLDGDKAVSAREYFSTNTRGRLLVGIQVWGNVALSGIHHVPDDTSLPMLLGLAGGPTGPLSRTTVTYYEASEKAGTLRQLKGADLYSPAAYRDFKLKSGDFVYVEVEPERDTLMRNLGIVSAVTGIVSAGLALYLVGQANK